MKCSSALPSSPLQQIPEDNVSFKVSSHSLFSETLRPSDSSHLNSKYGPGSSSYLPGLLSSVRLLSLVAQLCLTPCNPMDLSTPGLHVHHQFPEFPKLMSIELVMPSNHLILCCPLLLLPSIFPSIRVFSKVSVLWIRWPKCWSFSFNISPSNEHSGLISFRMDWLDLLAVQETLKSFLQHHSSKASILQCSALFMVQLPHLYMTTGKTIVLTRWTFVGNISAF